jgi:hypothetical protein
VSRGILRALVASVLVVAFATADYVIRPHLTQYVGDNDIYLLVIILAVEFIVTWRMVRGIPLR